MDLSRAFDKFATSTVYGWDRPTGTWIDLALKAAFTSYDRFISDREFGQKKRMITLAGDNRLPTDLYKVFRIGDVDNTQYLAESTNPDTMCDTTYGATVQLRELPFQTIIVKDAYTDRANGMRGEPTEEILDVVWGDYSRYSSLSSREFKNVDYSVVDIYVPINTEVDTDCKAKIDGQLCNIVEVSRTVDTLVLRAQVEDFQDTDGAPLEGAYSDGYNDAYN